MNGNEGPLYGSLNMHYYKHILFGCMAVLLAYTGSAQQITLQSHQKYFYGEGYGYYPKDMMWVNGKLVVSGLFSDDGNHPMATMFNSKGEWEKDLYYEKLKGSFSQIQPINDTCFMLYGRFGNNFVSSIVNRSMVQREPSLYEENGQPGALVGCTYIKGQLLHVFLGSGTIIIDVRDSKMKPVRTSFQQQAFYAECYFSDTRNTMYLFVHFGVDTDAKVLCFDITDPLKPVQKAESADEIPYREKDFVLDVKDNGFTVISNAYVTSEPDAEETTVTTEKKIYSYEVKNQHVNAVTDAAVPNDFAQTSYMAELGNNTYLMVWAGWGGISLHVYNNRLEELCKLDYIFPEDMEAQFTDVHDGMLVRLLDAKTVGVLIPYCKSDNTKGAISTWELYTFKLSI